MLKNIKNTKLSRLFLTPLLVVISLQAASLLFLALSPAPAQAAPKPLEMNLQVPIPGLNSHIVFGSDTGKIAEYIKAVYNYAIGIVGILAAVVIMIGGLMWITAGGNTSNIGEAKEMISASLTGLVLALTSYLLLSMVNPNLVNLQSSVIKSIPTIPGAAVTKTICSWTETTKVLDDPNNPDGGFSYPCPKSQIEMSGSCDSDNKPTAQNSANTIQCCCQQIQTFSGSDKCQKGTGSCAPENFSVFGDKAEQASAICQGESGGNPGIKSGSDICADGNSASWGLFQVNISAHNIGNLNCKSAFSSMYTENNHTCIVTDKNLYDRCVAAITDPATNINQAFLIFSQAGNKWKPWGFYNRNCSQSF